MKTENISKHSRTPTTTLVAAEVLASAGRLTGSVHTATPTGTGIDVLLSKTVGDAEPSRKSGTISLIAKFALAALLIMYAIQLHSPLRINTDAAVILRLTASLTDGKAYLLNDSRPLYPIGVPLTYSLMERAGIANSLGFGLLNLVCICVAAYATWIICRAYKMRPATSAAIILISFSNFVLIKHSVLPLTDIPYLMVSQMGCALLETYPKKRSGQKVIVLLLAIICVVGSIFTRRVGVALIPAVLYAIWRDARQSGFLKTPQIPGTARIMIVATAVVAVAIAAAIAIRHLLYLPDFRFRGSGGHAVVTQISMRMNNFGELVINAPASKVLHLHPLILIAGMLLAALIGTGLWRARHDWHATHIYFLTYLGILAIWPFPDARFWIPVLPLIAIAVFQAIAPANHSRIASRLTTAYLATYACLALVSLVYTTRISFSGSRFTTLFGDSSTHLAYEHALAGGNIDLADNWTFTIRRYGMVAAPKQTTDRVASLSVAFESHDPMEVRPKSRPGGLGQGG